MTSRCWKEIEESGNAHKFCLKKKLKSSSKDSDDLSMGFRRCIEAREKELTKCKTTRGNDLLGVFQTMS